MSVSTASGLWMDGCIVGSDFAIMGTFVSVTLQLMSAHSAESLSLQTLVAFVTTRLLHLMSHPLGMHYRPKQVPMLLFQALDVINGASGIACIVLFLVSWRTYDAEKDNFGIQLFDRFGLVPKSGFFSNRALLSATFIYALGAVLTVVWASIRGISDNWKLGYFGAAYEAMCTVALIPQLFMFHKDKWVSPTLGWFVVCAALSRICTFSFWLSLPWILQKWSVPPNRNIQLGCELLNILVLSDFLYYFIRAKVRGETRIRVGSSDSFV